MIPDTISDHIFDLLQAIFLKHWVLLYDRQYFSDPSIPLVVITRAGIVSQLRQVYEEVFQLATTPRSQQALRNAAGRWCPC